MRMASMTIPRKISSIFKKKVSNAIKEEEQRQIITAVVKPSPYAELEKYFNQPRRYAVL